VSTWIADYLDAWNSHDGNKVASFMTDDAVYEDLAVGQVHEGKAAITAFVQRTDVFSPDCEFVSVSEQNNGDSYAFEWEMIGTNTGEGAGFPATNKPFRIRGVSVGLWTRAARSSTTGTIGTWPIISCRWAYCLRANKPSRAETDRYRRGLVSKCAGAKVPVAIGPHPDRSPP
jgi:steroid delta-isomerase-like uncharacterized protein